MNNLLLKKYAQLIVKTGANVQVNQVVCINAPVEAKDLVRELVRECYDSEARFVHVKWNDQLCSKETYTGASVEELVKIHEHDMLFNRYIVDNKACNIAITSPIPNVYEGVDQKKIQETSLASAKAFNFVQDYFSNNFGQWVVAAYPNKYWAQKVFPNDSKDLAYQKLWEAILKAVHVDAESDPVSAWCRMNEQMSKRNQILNNYAFETLVFKNSLGTNLSVGLVNNHIWAGGGEFTNETKVFFNPNLPTEENFTMPHNQKTNGIVVSTKPLDFGGKLIENFSLEFKDGQVIAYKAEKNEEALKDLVNFDAGSARLGEVALVAYNSPISLMNILFFNTLFDENASCHLALGSAYGATNLKGALEMNEEQLKEAGCNISNTHVDFMFGSSDMKVIGITKNKDEVVIIENGNFVI